MKHAVVRARRSSEAPSGALRESALSSRPRVPTSASRGHASRGGRLWLIASLCGLLGQSGDAAALAQAVSSASVNCRSVESASQVGPIFSSCLHLQDANFAHAEATAQTILGERPAASVAAFREHTPFHFRQEVTASARLTYEFSLHAKGTPPVNVFTVPVLVDVLGTVSRTEQFNGNSTAPAAEGSASVLIRSDPSIPLVSADVLRESANTLATNLPNFDKTVKVSLVPGHVYTVDLIANCKHNDGGFVRAAFSTSSGCSATADPELTLDQATLDALLGANTFSLAEFFEFEFSPGVTAVPAPLPVMLFSAGLGVLAMRRRRATSAEHGH